jgi:hypothetical protein
MFVPSLIGLVFLAATLVLLVAIGYLVRGKNPKVPWYLGLLGGLIGYITSLMFWWIYGMVLWSPYRTQLIAFGMSIDTEGWVFGELFIPPVVGLLFLWSTWASLLALRQPMRYRKIAVVGSNLLPGLSLILLGTGSASSSFPAFGLAVLLTGLCWSFILYRIAIRRSNLIFAQS